MMNLTPPDETESPLEADAPIPAGHDDAAESAALMMEESAESEGNGVDAASVSSAHKMSLWARLMGQRQARWLDQLAEVDDAVMLYPEAPGNYVVRGELYLKLRQYALAQLDFLQAAELIEIELRERSWGIIAQALQDRVRRGLRRCERGLARVKEDFTDDRHRYPSET